MKRMYLFLCLTSLCMNFWGCPNENTDKGDKGDKEKIVEMTLYPETGQGRPWCCETWVDALVFSESDDDRQQLLLDIVIEGLDFVYERGYEYTFKARKVWMADPPQDVSSIKYQFIGPLSKKKAVLESSEEERVLLVSSEWVKYSPGFPTEYENGQQKMYDALLVTDINSQKMSILKEIEGFEYESGFEYTLSVKKTIQAEPYRVRYVLLEIKDKQKK